VIEHGAISEVPFYWVREICDEELPLPPHQPLTANPALGRHEGLIESLAKVSPMPKFVLKHMWPWRLVTEIQSSMQRIASLEGLSKSQPTKGPTAFSFWIASNMALKESEKLELLKMESTVERLRFIQAKVLALERQESFVCCRMCFTRFSAVSNLFTVGGADGTTGAYVNEYGVIHQTITLKEVDESKLLYSGRPETRESWFPGYSWTITHCRVCHSHIGWKFLHVKNHASNAVESSGRPKRFWGLSGASVTTTGPRVAPSLTRVAQENSEEATT
jgi:cereblon